MKKELFLFVFLSVFITLTDFGAQIRGAQTRYTVVNFGLNQPLSESHLVNSPIQLGIPFAIYYSDELFMGND